jgi:FkbM family methyltransferase
VIEYALNTATFRTPGGHDAVMIYREGTNDWNTLWASLNEDEYLLPSNLSGIAFDIGGYLGSVGIALALDNPELRVWIVEPVPPNQGLIARNIEANGVGDRVTLIRGAVGQGGESVDVWYGYRGNEAAVHHAFVGNSSLAYDSSGALPHETATYTALGLRDLLVHGPIDFLKIDTEGAEWGFLDSHLLTEVETIVGEWHPVRGHVIGDMLALLDETHVVTFSGPQAGPGGFRAVRR